MDPKVMAVAILVGVLALGVSKAAHGVKVVGHGIKAGIVKVVKHQK